MQSDIYQNKYPQQLKQYKAGKKMTWATLGVGRR